MNLCTMTIARLVQAGNGRVSGRVIGFSEETDEIGGVGSWPRARRVGFAWAWGSLTGL